MLIKTSTPHSLTAPKGTKEDSTLLVTPLVTEAADIPASASYRRPDLRTVGEQLEKIFAFETDLNRIVSGKQTSAFPMPIDQHSSRDFRMTIEFSRHRAVLRGTVRLRLEPTQLVIAFDDQLQLDFPE